MSERGDGAEGPSFRPLYRQVRDALARRIADGVWAAGAAIPSEPELAADLGVSQGTVRKALDALAAERLVVRRQGRGTYVARHDEARILFQFFKLKPDAGDAVFPESRVLSCALVPADAETAARLAIDEGEPVARLERVRSLAGSACVLETIAVAQRRFPGLAEREIPNNLYELYATAYGVPVARATERLKAVAADAAAAAALGVPLGAPLLLVDRTAHAIDGAPVERRLSLCRTDATHYLSELR